MRQIAGILTSAGLAIVVLLLRPVPSAAQTMTTPPARVGQITMLTGPSSFAPAGSSTWGAATPNYPVTSGDALYTQPGASAAISIGWSRLDLDGGTELQIARLDERTANLVLPQGETFLALHYLGHGEVYTVQTPRGTVTITRNGRYAIRAGDATAPTQVSVIDGDAQVQGQNVSLRVISGETVSLSGADPVRATLGGLVTDPFIERMLTTHLPPAPIVAPAVVTGMTGAAVLSAYGSWSTIPTYGAIWYPRVAAGWAPYRHGHWAFILPWGWTWIDDNPWGFAPFHYGRWVHEHGRWGWLPAPAHYAVPAYAPPVYAPALVSFFDVRSGVSIGIGLTAGSLAGGAIGWIPLAPDEPYLPWYRCPPAYVEQLNRFDVRNPDRWRDIDASRFAAEHHPGRLLNRQAATVIAAEAMRRGDPVGKFGHLVSGTVLAAARPVVPEQTGRPHPSFGRLPTPPRPEMPRRPAAPPRPAPFAASRGLPIRLPEMRAPGHPVPSAGRSPSRPGTAIPGTAHRPQEPQIPARPQTAKPPARAPQPLPLFQRQPEQRMQGRAMPAERRQPALQAQPQPHTRQPPRPQTIRPPASTRQPPAIFQRQPERRPQDRAVIERRRPEPQARPQPGPSRAQPHQPAPSRQPPQRERDRRDQHVSPSH